MKQEKIGLVILFCMLVVVIQATGGGFPQRAEHGTETIYTSWGSADKALLGINAPGDTVWVLNPSQGDFQEISGTPSLEGWSSVDLTASTTSNWRISTFNAANLDPGTPSNNAWWCGRDDFPACSPTDVAGGYGNNWYEVLEYQTTIYCTDKRVVTGSIGFDINIDVETDSDHVVLQSKTDDDKDPVEIMDIATSDTTSISPTKKRLTRDFTVNCDGDSTTLYLQMLFWSDGSGSDEDCQWPTNGAVQIDNIEVWLDGELDQGHVEDCEPGTPNLWQPLAGPGVGDFAKAWINLEDIAPCFSNYGGSVAFVDDGYGVPGTGGSLCLNWCYGPSGYVVNSYGGLDVEGEMLHNEINSPPIAWPGGTHNMGALIFDVYRHSVPDLNSPGIFYYWKVRSTDSSDQNDLTNQEWVNRDFLYFGPGAFRHHNHAFGDLLVPGAQWVQVALGVRQFDDIWGSSGNDATPAPYFDNVEVAAINVTGPVISAKAVELAQDAFPESGTLNVFNLGENSVRFDMARGRGMGWPVGGDAGDSIVFSIDPLHSSATLSGPPVIHYLVNTNPVFNPYRTHPLSGQAFGDSVRNDLGVVIPDQFSFDLPDTGLMYPGDELHYFVSASTGSPVFGTAILPVDTTGFNTFGLGSLYHPAFTVRALPSVEVTGRFPDLTFEFPEILWWDDGGESGHRYEWESSLRNLGLIQGVDIDIFRTRSPNGGFANGLGSRASVVQVSGYETILYSSGTLSGYALTVGNETRDPGGDYNLLKDWMLLNDKNLFLSGDHLAADLYSAGGFGPSFLSGWMEAEFQGRNLKLDLHYQVAPEVVPIPSNPVFDDNAEWAILGSCRTPLFREFDSVIATGGGQRLAEFLNRTGGSGSYAQAAAILSYQPAINARVISLPYDLSAIIMTDSFTPAGTNTRTYVLDKVLQYFGNNGSGSPSGVPARPSFNLGSVAPNPFNPKTEIHFELGTEAVVEIRIFDVKGSLVKVLLEGWRPSGPGSIMWDGTDHGGRKVAAGVYFVQAKSGGQTEVRKLALVK